MDKLPGSYKLLDDGSLVPNLDDSAMADRLAEERNGEGEIQRKDEPETGGDGEAGKQQGSVSVSPDPRFFASLSPDGEVMQ